MIKGKWKQAAHVRRVKTKEGYKPMLINKHVRKAKKSVVLKPTDRRIFNYLGSPNFKKEYGGGIDFDKKGKIEYISLVPGDYDEIMIPEEDFEALFHTHPPTPGFTHPPSPEDIHGFLGNKQQQAELIINGDTTFIVLKSKKISKPTDSLFKKLDSKYEELRGVSPDWIKKWHDFVELETGLKILVNKNPESRLVVPVEPIEPRVKKAEVPLSGFF
jgi:hypothetical protein